MATLHLELPKEDCEASVTWPVECPKVEWLEQIQILEDEIINLDYQNESNKYKIQDLKRKIQRLKHKNKVLVYEKEGLVYNIYRLECENQGLKQKIASLEHQNQRLLEFEPAQEPDQESVQKPDQIHQ